MSTNNSNLTERELEFRKDISNIIKLFIEDTKKFLNNYQIYIKYNMLTIDLSKYLNENKVFSGKDFGMKVRKELDLDGLDETGIIAIIDIPSDTISLNLSFFLGLFGPSIRKLNKCGFACKYIFKYDNDIIIETGLEKGIEIALNDM